MREITLITGGCGFVGRHLARKLLAEKKRVIWIVDNLSTGIKPAQWLPDTFTVVAQSNSKITYGDNNNIVTFIEQDCIDFFYNQINQTGLPLPQFDQIFHLASVVGGRVLIESKPMSVAIDLAIDATFFLWLVSNKSRPARVLYASSSAAYPIDLQAQSKAVALAERYIKFGHSLGMPDMTYGWSKLTGEYLSQIAAQQYGIQVACVRPFSGYGGDQDQSYPVPAIARRAAAKEDPLIVWGTGRQGRDFIHIDDCIEAMLLAIQKIKDGSAINIGTGQLTTFLDVARMFAEFAGYKPKIKPLLNKPSGVQSRYCDPSLMKTVLGWEPRISIRDGFQQVLREQQAAVLLSQTKQRLTV